AIQLIQVSDTVIEGRLVGDDNPATPADHFVAFRITLVDADKPTAHIVVDQFLAIDHGGTEDPSVFDEQQLLNITNGDSLSLKLVTTVTDGDGDHADSPVQLTLIGSQQSFIAFDDDGPTITRINESETPPGTLALLNLDETIGTDRYSTPGDDNPAHDNNGDADDKATIVTVSTAPAPDQAI